MPDRLDNPVPSLLARHRRLGGVHAGCRRVTGVHRAEGLAGPTGRYLFIVALLAGMASLPIVAALSAGSATVGGTALPGGTTPFIGSPSDGPVVVVPLPPTALAPDEPPLVGVIDPLAMPGNRHDAARTPDPPPDRPRSRTSDRPRPGPATAPAASSIPPHSTAALGGQSSQPLSAPRPMPPADLPATPPAVEPQCPVPRSIAAAVDRPPPEARHRMNRTPDPTLKRGLRPYRAGSPGERQSAESGTVSCSS